MPYTGGGGVQNPMQIATCPGCGIAANQTGTCPANCGVTLDHPFVAVFEIGQGNCNALIDAQGRLLAFFDFGYSTNNKTKPAVPFVPCFCDQPMIILSHWDLDHINLIKTQPQALTLRWIVPEQTHSDFAGTVMTKIKEAGGELCVVPAADTANPHEYMTFPWGFVERCTADNDKNPNGSGLAAFVCVRDGTGPLDAGVVAPRNLAASPVGAPAQRARDAVAAVAAEVLAQLGPILNPAAVSDVARPVAAALAASQTLARQAFMPIDQCVTAAVRASARATAGDDAATIQAALHADLAMLKTRNNGWWNEAVTQLARAAHAANAKRSRRKRAVAATSRFAYDGRLTNTGAHKLIAVAATAPAQPPLPTLKTGLPPFRSDERFILLNGDANFKWVPSLVATRRPSVAVLTAMHHGAIFEDVGTLSSAHIPFAPGSKAARAVERLWRSAGNGAGGGVSLVELVSKAAYALRKPGTSPRALRVEISRAACAAAAAVWAVDAEYPNEVTVDPEKFGAVAAAAAVAAVRYPDARTVGIAATLASTTITTCGDMDASPIETVIELAAKGVAAQVRGAALDYDGVKATAAGGVDGDLLRHLITIFNEAVTSGQAPLTADNAGGNAATAHQILFRDYKFGLKPTNAKNYLARIRFDAGDENVVNDLASAATAAIQASKRIGGRERRRWHRSARDITDAAVFAISAAPATHYNAVSGTVRTTLQSGYWTPPTTRAEQAALVAATLAAEKMAAILVGTSADAIRTVIAGAHDPNIRKQAIDAAGLRMLRHPWTGRIAYSYGVSNTNPPVHEFSNQTKTAGYMGHPHPFAVLRYQAHGWIRRANTSQRARHTSPQGDPDRRHPMGHVALAWDSQHNLPMSDKPFTHQCATCNRSYTLRS